MTTEPTPLQELIERELEEMFDGGGFDARDMARDLAPLIAAEVQAAKAEALRNLPPHLSLKIHQCPARESGGTYCALEKGHSGDHRVLDVPDGWVLGAVDRYIERTETGDQA